METEERACVDVQKFQEDTLRSCSIESPVPEVTRQQECCMGIDEAGRGPVLGLCVPNKAHRIHFEFVNNAMHLS